MVNPINAIRGMNDVLPVESVYWQYVENILRQVFQSYGYQEIRLPLLEKTELFKRSIGEATDIVEKEMYTFLDRSNESLTLRPEGTAGCVRAGNEHGLFYNQIQRLWYLGPYFRYERPQKGRYRQFHQCGAEAFGITTPDIDAELIIMSANLLKKLGLAQHVKLELNSLGSVSARLSYRTELVNYFTLHADQLDEDSQRRLVSNPLRILDSKNPTMQQLIEQAPRLLDHLDEESAQHFNQLQAYLISAGISYTINPRLVRGLDYYTKTVFEWTTTELGAQGTVCAGGRYDGLVEQLGGRPTPAVGFALGMERTILLLQQLQPELQGANAPHVYFITQSDDSFKEALKITSGLRDKLPWLRILMNCGGGAFKNQFKKADKSGAELALILGDDELANQTVGVKFLREASDQVFVKVEELGIFLEQKVGSKQ